jgi:indolepyruvate ferredoxin oxidoreductase alpha subunit
LGVEHVFEVDPYDLKSLEEVLRSELAREELSVVIASRPCILISREQQFQTIAANPQKCQGCKKCLQLGCPALSFAGDYPVIDENICQNCTLCFQLCPQGAIKVGKEDE